MSVQCITIENLLNLIDKLIEDMNEDRDTEGVISRQTMNSVYSQLSSVRKNCVLVVKDNKF